MDDPVSAPPRLRPAVALAVVAGGAVGVLLRGLLTLPVPPSEPALQILLTAAINVVGSFLLGAVVARLGGTRALLRAFAGTGILGGFTTYSAFAVQTVELARTAPILALALVAGSLGGGLLAAWAGLVAGGRVGRGHDRAPSPREAE